MLYVTATEKKKNQKICFKCNTIKESLIVLKNLVENDYSYSHVTIKNSSPYLRNKKIKRYDESTFPSIYRIDN